jgi:hypothetical protein
MKSTLRSRSLLTSSLVLVAALGLAACSDRDRSEIRSDTANVVDKAKAGMAEAWDDVKDYSYDRKEDFVASSKAMTAKLDAEISEMRADYASANASAERKAAWEKITTARTTFDQKMNALGSATSATWEQAKRETIAAWDNLQAAYRDARD